ncbi:MAG: methyltransferase domain-containing protein [Pseudomonadales bacterium]|nr:methyltransferase domain-containing protein [Pseudomonadales bacterium]
MIKKQDFYDKYHKKNQNFYKVIGKNNFTYYEILRFFYKEIINKFLIESKLKEKKFDFSKLKILDVGCGVGTLALYFASLGANVRGIDVSQRAIDICKNAKKQLGLKNVTFEKKLLKKGQGKFGLVIVTEVIEHIENESKFLNEIRSQLIDHGLLYLTTPSKNNWLYRLGFFNKFDKEVGHLRRYSEAKIKELLTRNGFEVLEIKSVEGPLRNLLFTTKIGFLIKLIKGPLVPIFHWFDFISLKLFGATDILVVARSRL